MISIIVPIYKVEDYLHRCVDSILAQTYEDFELILVDDGSPDGCGAICDQYAAQDARIKVIHKENGGLSDARNAGLQVAQGEYIAFVDSDDWLMPNYLKYLLNTLLEQDADICECGILRTDGSAALPEEALTEANSFDTQTALRLLIEDSIFHQYVWNKLYRKEVIGQIAFAKGKTNEDEFWTYQVFGNAKKIAKIDTPLYMYFQRSDSIMGAGYSIKRLDALEAKMQRLHYIDTHFPGLHASAKNNLFGSCIYAGQMSLLHLKNEQKKQAKQKIRTTVKDCSMTLRECAAAGGHSAVWFSLAWFSFWGTCRLKNLLKKGL